jgi:hypothetical protein
MAGQTTHLVRLERDYPESFIPPRFAPRRSLGQISRIKESGHGLTEVTQRLLLDHLRTSGQPLVLGSNVSELLALLQVARSTRSRWTPMRMLLDSKIPNKPCMRAVFQEHCLLGKRRIQTVTRHTNTLATASDNPSEATR